MLKYQLKTRQSRLCSRHEQEANGTENLYACNGQRERLQGISLTGKENSIMQTQK